MTRVRSPVRNQLTRNSNLDACDVVAGFEVGGNLELERFTLACCNRQEASQSRYEGHHLWQNRGLTNVFLRPFLAPVTFPCHFVYLEPLENARVAHVAACTWTRSHVNVHGAQHMRPLRSATMSAVRLQPNPDCSRTWDHWAATLLPASTGASKSPPWCSAVLKNPHARVFAAKSVTGSVVLTKRIGLGSGQDA